MTKLVDVSLFTSGVATRLTLQGSVLVVNKSYNFHRGLVETGGARLLNVALCAPGGLRGPRLSDIPADGKDGDIAETITLEADEAALAAQPIPERRRSLLKLLHQGAVDVAAARAWDTAPFEQAMSALADGVPDLEIVIAEKPTRRRDATGLSRLAVSEAGIHVWLEIMDPQSGESISMTDRVRVSGGSVQEAMRAYGRLVWAGDELTASATSKRVEQGSLRLTRSGL